MNVCTLARLKQKSVAVSEEIHREARLCLVSSWHRRRVS